MRDAVSVVAPFRCFMTQTAASSARDIEWLLSEPPPAVVAAVGRMPGDFAVLGVGGKMGTTLAVMLRRALDAAGRSSTVVTGVSRFSRCEGRQVLEDFGVRTLPCDLADAGQVARLPPSAHVLYLAGQKFGTESAPETTWIQNTVVPALVAQHFRTAGIVVFSTGCVYPFLDTRGPGASETEPLAFNGEYASTCIGRERVFSHYSRQLGTRQLMFRLNYAIEPRYGVLVDIAAKVWANEPVDVTTGWFNCIWQGDACAQAIQCLEHVGTPPTILNVTGAEKISVRVMAQEFGRRFGREPRLVGTEAPTAWLSDASKARRLFGPPSVSIDRMVALVAEHVQGGGALLGRPTHFEVRSGKF